MRLTLPDALGLIIGFSLGGLALALYLPPSGDPPGQPAGEPAPAPTAVRPVSATPPAPTHPAPTRPTSQRLASQNQVTAAVQPRRLPDAVAPRQPASPASFPGSPSGSPSGSPPGSPLGPAPPPLLPEVVTPSPPTVSTMPNVIRPTEQSKNVGLSGTGFFIAGDGLVMTAAHVVDGCKTTQVASRFVPTAPARILATDTRNDLALLRAPSVRPPGVMAFATAPAPGAHLTLYGYPAGSDTLIPTEALGTLRNDRAQGQQALPSGQIVQASNRPADARDFLWIDAQAVRQGFSGGPIVGPRGDVVGVLKGMVVNRDPGGGGPTTPTGIAIGPGTRPIMAFVQQEIPTFDIDAATRLVSTDSAENARKSVVHVFCWR